LEWGGFRYGWQEGADETEAAARQSLDKARIFGGVVERLAQFVQGRAEAVVEIHLRAIWPELLTDFFAAHHLPRMFQQERQQLERLRLQPDLSPVFSQLAGAQIRFKLSKGNAAWCVRGRFHLALQAIFEDRKLLWGDASKGIFRGQLAEAIIS